MNGVKKPKPAAELRSMIKEARRQIDELPVGQLIRQGKHIRLDAQEKRLFGGKSK
jgi:hypothetical protein